MQDRSYNVTDSQENWMVEQYCSIHLRVKRTCFFTSAAVDFWLEARHKP